MIYKVNRLTRSLADFAKLVELFRPALGAVRFRDPVIQYDEQHGRLTLNVLLSFAQFEREVIGERVRDKIAPPRPRASWWAARCRSAIGASRRSWSWCPRKPEPSG